MKILITYASAGDGHKKAAEAVYRQLLEQAPGADIVFVDSLNYSTRFFKFCYKRVYIILIKYLPWLWGFFYRILNNRFFFLIALPLRRAVNILNSKKLVNFLFKEDFDVIVSTHFFAIEVISRLKEKHLSETPLINVVTDFKEHLYWLARNVDRYVVGSDSVKQGFIRRGVAEEKIAVLGIPVRKRFSLRRPKEEAREMLKLSSDTFTILMMGGGLGVGPIREVVSDMQKLDFDCQIMVVCGHNKKLFMELEKMSGAFTKDTRIRGFCHNIDMIMAASDIMISKAGGVTVSESLAMGLPLICISPIPGQESANAQFLFDNSIGFLLKGRHEINNTIKEFFYSADKSKHLKEKITSLAKPHSAKETARLAIETAR